MRILMIDDEPVFLDTLSKRLRKQGFTVTTASNGREGLDRFLNSPDEFDLILTDIQMPIMDGLEVLKQIRHQDHDTPVIIMTGHSELEKSIQALRLGAFDYLLKPLDLGQLYSSLRKLKSIRISLTQVSEILPLTEGHVSITIPSRIRFVEGAIALLQKYLDPVCQANDINIYSISLCLQEAITNAIIHGNLELSSSLKEESWEQFDTLRAEREEVASFGDRKTIIRFEFNSNMLRFEIEDEGQGFDVSALPDFNNPNTLLSTGRGLLYIFSFMDSVSWNEGGNCIIMVKKLLG